MAPVADEAEKFINSGWVGCWSERTLDSFQRDIQVFVREHVHQSFPGIHLLGLECDQFFERLAGDFIAPGILGQFRE